MLEMGVEKIAVNIFSTTSLLSLIMHCLPLSSPWLFYSAATNRSTSGCCASALIFTFLLSKDRNPGFTVTVQNAQCDN